MVLSILPGAALCLRRTCLCKWYAYRCGIQPPGVHSTHALMGPHMKPPQKVSVLTIKESNKKINKRKAGSNAKLKRHPTLP